MMAALQPAIGAALGPAARVEERRDGTWVLADGLDVEAMARALDQDGWRLATMTGLPRGDETTLIYHYVRAGERLHFKTCTRGGGIASITPIVRAASWIEREIHDFFAVPFAGHPNLAPLLRPQGLAEGFFREPADAPAAAAPPTGETP